MFAIPVSNKCLANFDRWQDCWGVFGILSIFSVWKHWFTLGNILQALTDKFNF